MQMFLAFIFYRQLGSLSKLFLNRYCEDGIDPLLRSLASYGIIGSREAQCFEIAANVTTGSYLLIPFVTGLALCGTYVVKAYIQYLRERLDEEDDLSEEEKLRAFDRTTWDNRENAVENMRPPPVLFTDTFRWTLRPAVGTGVGSPSASYQPSTGEQPKIENVTTFPVADTSSSEDDNNVDKSPDEGGK